MGMFHPVNISVVTRNQWVILLSKICAFFNLVKTTSKNVYNYRDPKYVISFLVVSNFVIFTE